MKNKWWLVWVVCVLATWLSSSAAYAQTGSIRGVVYDADFDGPLPFAEVLIVENQQKTTATEDGLYVLEEVPPGTYTLVFSREGYARIVETDVVVLAGQLTDVDASLSGEFVDIDPFVVEVLNIGGGTEAFLLDLRSKSPSLLDSIGSAQLSQAGASNAADALNLVSGATVQDGKFAVIRGLPDRYVVSQLKGVRLPSADEETRAAELDQFPSGIIESVQISKTFTPDQLADASGGAVNIVLKGIPEQTIFDASIKYSYNTNTSFRDDFLSYNGGGVNTFGNDTTRRIQTENIGSSWTGAVGIARTDAPVDYKMTLSAGTNYEFDNGVRIGGFVNLFYERDSSFRDDEVDDALWVDGPPGTPLTPAITSGAISNDNPRTALFDITRASQSVEWGGLITTGIESEDHEINLTYLFTRIAEDEAILSEDTRGKEFFFPGYDPDDINDPGNDIDNVNFAPYRRSETLIYTERITETFILNGEHTLPFQDFGIEDFMMFKKPVLDWTYARSTATLDEPDKRLFASRFEPRHNFLLGLIRDARHVLLRPADSVSLGNLQRTFTVIVEESNQSFVNLKLPFDQWDDEEGYLKFGVYSDNVVRTFNQDGFTNLGDPNGQFITPSFDDLWSAVFPTEVHNLFESEIDVDYRGEQNIFAYYGMIDLPITSNFRIIGGLRYEDTEIAIQNTPDTAATFFPIDQNTIVALTGDEADVSIQEENVLPAVSFVFNPIDEITIRGSYTETIARMTFRELTPVRQQEFIGSSIFIGNNQLQFSSLKNYDLRFDYTPAPGSLVSVSYFFKDITDPIEFVQRVVGFSFTVPVNLPKGEISGLEFEVRQDLGEIWEDLEGLSIGGNATLIDSTVELDQGTITQFTNFGLVGVTTRDATNAPEFLYNAYLTYAVPDTGTQLSLFYTVKGDTLIAGAGFDTNNFVPDIYATEFGTLNFTVSQKIGDNFSLQFQAKNLTNPEIKEVYRSPITVDTVRTSFTRGIDLSIALKASFTF